MHTPSRHAPSKAVILARLDRGQAPYLRSLRASNAQATPKIRHLGDTPAPVEEYDIVVTWSTDRCVEGAGSLPALLLDQGPLPPTTTLCLSLGGRKETQPC